VVLLLLCPNSPEYNEGQLHFQAGELQSRVEVNGLKRVSLFWVSESLCKWFYGFQIIKVRLLEMSTFSHRTIFFKPIRATLPKQDAVAINFLKR